MLAISWSICEVTVDRTHCRPGYTETLSLDSVLNGSNSEKSASDKHVDAVVDQWFLKLYAKHFKVRDYRTWDCRIPKLVQIFFPIRALCLRVFRRFFEKFLNAINTLGHFDRLLSATGYGLWMSAKWSLEMSGVQCMKPMHRDSMLKEICHVIFPSRPWCLGEVCALSLSKYQLVEVVNISMSVEANHRSICVQFLIRKLESWWSLYAIKTIPTDWKYSLHETKSTASHYSF